VPAPQRPYAVRLLVPLTLSLVAAAPCDAQPRRAQTGLVPIVIETRLGTIEAVLDSAHAPVSVTNFLRYVDASLYAGAQFHRALTRDNQPGSPVRIEVIQASLDAAHIRPGVRGVRARD